MVAAHWALALAVEWPPLAQSAEEAVGQALSPVDVAEAAWQWISPERVTPLLFAERSVFSTREPSFSAQSESRNASLASAASTAASIVSEASERVQEKWIEIGAWPSKPEPGSSWQLASFLVSALETG